MKTRLPRLAFLAVLLAPLLAQAHPGHDGPHDFEWDFGHLAGHPVATVLCLAVLAVGLGTVWQLFRMRRAGRPDTR